MTIKSHWDKKVYSLGYDLKNGEKQSFHTLSKMSKRWYRELRYGCGSLASGENHKVMEASSGHVKEMVVMGNNQHRFIERNKCLTNPIAFCDEMNELVNKGKAMAGRNFPSLPEILKAELAKALSSLAWPNSLPCFEQEVEEDTWWCLFSLNYSVSLYRASETIFYHRSASLIFL